MKIREKPCTVYDVEVFLDIFHVTAKDTETGEIFKFEISIRKNQLKELVKFFYTPSRYFVGYNNHHYDDLIINYCFSLYDLNEPWYDTCYRLYKLSQFIINTDEDGWDKIKKWKYGTTYHSLDLMTMLYSKKLRVGLKSLQITMHYHNVLEFQHDWNKPLGIRLFDEMIEYNINDVLSSEELLNRSKNSLELRIEAEDEYNVNVLSKDYVNVGMEILKQEYLKHTGLDWEDIRDLRSPMDVIPLKDVILPFVKYDSPILKKMLSEMKEAIVSPGRKGFEYEFVFGGLRYSVGVGGIHSKNDPEIIEPKENEVLADYDVASLYPSMLIEYDFYPRHCGKEFKEVYSGVKEKRMKAKHAKQANRDEMLKFALNGLSGNLQNKFTWVYDPFAVMQIRINGQLLLLMLAEKLVEAGVRVIQTNTDGLFLLYDKKLQSEVDRINKEWEDLTHLKLEGEFFKGLYQMAINDYFAIPVNGKIKKKGVFITDVKLGKGLKPKIIPKAVIAYLSEGIPIEETIKKCDDIRDFLMSEKTGNQWEVEYNGELQQRINRFYASTNGAYLYKRKLRQGNYLENLRSTIGYMLTEEEYAKREKEFKSKPLNEQLYQYNNMLSDSGVTLLNKFDDKPISERNINYRYYIMEAYKLVREMKPLQLSLW